MAVVDYIVSNGKRVKLKDSSARRSIGSCSELKTETKHCLVDAVNELCQKVENGGGASSSDVLTTQDIPKITEAVIAALPNAKGVYF